MAAVSQPLAPRAALAAAGVQNNSTPAGPSGMDLAGQTNLQLFKPYVIDPYLAPFNGSTYITESQVISKLWPASSYSRVQAQGMITDGSATAIVVAQLGKNKQVTFTGTDGIQFESWNPSFLSYPPSYGNCAGSCSIAVNPTQGSDGNYYAFALVLAPKQSTSINYGPSSNQTASITASIATDSGTFTSKPTYLGIGPTPVILVHGLWGKNTGMNVQLDDLDSALPWKSATHYTPVSETCYASSIPFDAVNDLGAGCYQSSADALKHSISDLQSSLYNAHYVGGRVDVVAHSMGGLATRHYAATSDYTSTQNKVRSRTLGPLRTIVTVDTPETGSPLATALLTQAISGGTCLFQDHSTPGSPTCQGYSALTTASANVWRATCGPDVHTTLAQCLAKHQMPLGPPNSPNSISLCTQSNQGAYVPLRRSLSIPGSPNIQELPDVNNIQNQNVNWFAIESDWQDTGGDSPSLLRAFLDDLLGAMQLHSSLPQGNSAQRLTIQFRRRQHCSA